MFEALSWTLLLNIKRVTFFQDLVDELWILKYVVSNFELIPKIYEIIPYLEKSD